MPEGDFDPNPAMQFEVADYSTPQAGPACGACKRPITETYFTANGTTLCHECHGAFAEALTGGSKIGRLFKATALGLLAGLAGAALWYAVRRITNYEIGLIAIVVGVMVGVAVRKGSDGRGGWFYQALAVVLTYGCICAQYMPDIIQGIMAPDRDGAAVADDNKLVEKADDAAPAADPPGEKAGGVKFALALILLAVVAFVISLAVPFLGGAQGVIGLLIIGFALYEAWKINKGMAVHLAGPFQLSPAPPQPLAEAADA